MLTTGGLTQAIEDAFTAEWRRAKGSPAPQIGAQDRRLMFAAVARGVLRYLKDHQTDLLASITLRDAAGGKAWTVVDATLDIQTG